MDINASDLARAQLALERAVGAYLYDDERRINVIDIGQYETEGRVYATLALRFHVDWKIPDSQLEALERTPLQELSFFGIPNMVKVHTPRLQQWYWPTPPTSLSANPHAVRQDPLLGGISISTSFSGAGTLGGIVRDRPSGREMLLSNWHVLAAFWGAQRGQSIRQPSRSDGGTYADIVGALERDAMSLNLDAAVAYLNDTRGFSNRQLGIGQVTGVRKPELGMLVEKAGRSSRVTAGRVTGIEGVARMSYSGVQRLIRNVAVIEPERGEVSRGGDSGSWWLDQETRAAVGLHFAGGNNPEHGLAMDMGIVLQALDVTLAG